MERVFNLTLPADTTYHNLYTALLALTGAVPANGILPDRVYDLKIVAASTNGANTISVADNNFANSTGLALASGDVFYRTSNRNAISLKDLYLAGSAASQAVIVSFGAL